MKCCRPLGDFLACQSPFSIIPAVPERKLAPLGNVVCWTSQRKVHVTDRPRKEARQIFQGRFALLFFLLERTSPRSFPRIVRIRGKRRTLPLVFLVVVLLALDRAKKKKHIHPAGFDAKLAYDGRVIHAISRMRCSKQEE